MSLRTVIIGFGQQADTLANDARMARYFPKATHAAVLHDHPAFDWCAVVDPDPAARARATERWGIAETVADVGELADPGAFDCAVIATPPMHRRGLLERLPGLKAVMLEKPVADTLSAAEQLGTACQARGLKVQVNYWRRGVVAFRALADGGLAERVGAVQTVFGVYGGGLRTNGSHLIDFVRMLAGEIAGAAPARDARPAADAPVPGDIAATLDLTLADGAPVRLVPLDFGHYREVGLDIWGTRGRLSITQESLVAQAFPVVDNRGLENAREVASDRPVSLNVVPADAFKTLYDNLADSIAVDTALVSPLSSALATERLIDMAVGDHAAATPKVRLA